MRQTVLERIMAELVCIPEAELTTTEHNIKLLIILTWRSQFRRVVKARSN